MASGTQSRLQVARDSALYLSEIREAYTERYPGKWIAVLGHDVYGPADTVQALQLDLQTRRVDLSVVQFAKLDPAFKLPMVL